MPEIYYALIVIAIVVLAGGGMLLVRRSGRGEAIDPPARSSSLVAGDDLVPGGAIDVAERADTDSTESGSETLPEQPTVEDGDAFAATIASAEAATIDEELEELLGDRKPSFRDRLGKARSSFSGYFGSVLSRSGIDEESWDELQEALILADVGVGPTNELLDSVRATVKEKGITSSAELLEAVKAEMKLRLAGPVDLKFAEESPTVWIFVGVNGVGKTTSIGKVGRMLADNDKSVVMAAGDTFRAAAAEQLAHWADLSGAELVRGAEGGDPSSVIYDAISSGSAKGADVVLADTAGRLHTKTNLMEELAKVRRVADKAAGSVTEVLLVLDATTGQNGLNQARKFTEATDVTGVVLTKMDGSAKGGIVFAIRSELGIPVKLMGLGEGAHSLVEFDSDEFVDALFDRPEAAA